MSVGIVGVVRNPPSSGFPGQDRNPVGFSATPAAAPSTWNQWADNSTFTSTWPGAFSSLTAWPGGTGAQTISDGTNATSGAGTAANPWVFAFYDFDSLTGGVLVSANNVVFVGCRFQSNQVNNYNIQPTGTKINFYYCSVVPLVSLHTSPPNAAWPSAGAGLQIVPASAAYTNTGGYCVPSTDGYQYGLNITSGGPLLAEHCDIWGFGNSIVFYSTTTAMKINACWIHDAANCNVAPPAAGTNYHTDGPGYLNGGVGTTHVTITGCTIATIGNTNGIAFQLTTAAYDAFVINSNYLSGFGVLISLSTLTGGGDTMTNTTFHGNTIGTDNPWIFNLTHNDYSTMFRGGGNSWSGNTLKFLAGTSPNAGATPSFTSANDGNFVYPDGTLNTVEFS